MAKETVDSGEFLKIAKVEVEAFIDAPDSEYWPDLERYLPALLELARLGVVSGAKTVQVEEPETEE